MRGKVVAKTLGYVEGRITPAYAGKSFATISSEAPFRDHPRLCGEKEGTATKDKVVAGSPPPMRGKVAERRKQLETNRITPAYAGKSFRKTAVRHAIKDHPRLCGEKCYTISHTVLRRGSPPPMRGKD